MPTAPTTPTTPTTPTISSSSSPRATPGAWPLPSAVVRFAGDSGDGMQLAGTQFTDTSAVVGNDVATLPDYPAEIRAPAGTVAGVSGFQINFASEEIYTPGDRVNALIAMNPAALKAHLGDVEPGGIVVVNESEFNKVNLRKAGYGDANPLDDDALTGRYQFFKVPISRLNEESLAETGMGAKDIGRCKNMWALGLIYWLYARPLDVTIDHLNDYFGKKKKLPEVAEANIRALKAGYYFGETAELFPTRYEVNQADIPSGEYRKITGNEALAMGLVTAGELAGKGVVYCGYPITPASSILHALSNMKRYGVKTFQAEDEIAAVCAALGASFAGQIGVCGTSGPGLALKAETVGLAVMTELPLVVIDVQRGGPSTGLPTKTEQSDLLQAMYGRNGDAPTIVLAAKSPGDCFDTAIEAVRLSLEHMTPVVVLTDGYLANGSEPWPIPDATSFPPIKVSHPGLDRMNGNGDGNEDETQEFIAYQRDESLVRPWAIPGTPGYEHRIGGIEKAHPTGNVSYDPENHQRMTRIRMEKVARVADRLPPLVPMGGATGDLLLIGWGGTFGSIHTAVSRARAKGKRVSHAHLRHINPMPKNLGEIIKGFDRVLVPELNTGQLIQMLRGRYLVDAKGLNKVQGRPFLVEEIESAIELMLADAWGESLSLSPWGHKVEPGVDAAWLGQEASAGVEAAA